MIGIDLSFYVQVTIEPLFSKTFCFHTNLRVFCGCSNIVFQIGTYYFYARYYSVNFYECFMKRSQSLKQ